MSDWFLTMEDSFWLQPDEEGQDEAAFIEKALKLQKGQHVLDAPCGAGRILFHLVKSGYAVEGLDLRDNFIKRARARLRREGLKAGFTVMDLRELDFTDRFHGIYNWGGSFGYFSDKENLELLRRYNQALRHGGRLLVGQRNREYIHRHFLPEIELNERFTLSNKWDKQTQRYISERTLDNRSDTKNTSSMRLYTPRQMRNLFEQAGLTVEEIYGSLSGDKYKRSGEWMITVGRNE